MFLACGLGRGESNLADGDRLNVGCLDAQLGNTSDACKIVGRKPKTLGLSRWCVHDRELDRSLLRSFRCGLRAAHADERAGAVVCG